MEREESKSRRRLSHELEVLELVLGPGDNPGDPVTIETVQEVVAAINRVLTRLQNAPRFEFGRGAENFVLYLRQSDGEVVSRNLRGPRGRQGRRGRSGPAPEHEWSADGKRIRFRNPTGEWGEWSADLSSGGR